MIKAVTARAELLRSAAELFQVCGYAAVSIRDIVASVNLPKGTFYNYFRSKEELVSIIVSQECDGFLGSLSSTTSSSFSETSREPVKPAEGDIFGSHTSFLQLLSILAAESPALPAQLRQQVATALTHLHEWITLSISRAQEQGDISAEESPDRLATLLISERLGATIWQKCQPDSQCWDVCAAIGLGRILRLHERM